MAAESGPLPWGAPPQLAVGTQIECELEVADEELAWLEVEVQEAHGNNDYSAVIRIELGQPEEAAAAEDAAAGGAAAAAEGAAVGAETEVYEKLVPVRLRILSDSLLEVSESDGSGDGCVQRRWRMPAASLEEIYERALLAMAQRVGHVGTLSGGRSVPEVARAMAAGMQEAITRIVHESADEGEAEISADTAHRVLAQIAAERGLPPPRPPPGTQPPQPPAREP